MDNKDRENLICFLGKFQGGGEPSKDIFSRYPENDLKDEVYNPLTELVEEIEEYLVFETDVYKPKSQYPFREDQKVLRFGVHADKESQFDWLYEVRSSGWIELTDKGIDNILQTLSDRSACAFCFCEWINGIDRGGEGSDYFLLRYNNDQEGRRKLKKMIMEHLENSMPTLAENSMPT
ncbi:hypothetical protein LCGC14_2501270 [marine sediment metagenome]|uniref:Uncharacterized protein n=1 Tax=marine sediment metagenome TaxID=412755 RepID=A0A0F9DDK0_9ZZZZ